MFNDRESLARFWAFSKVWQFCGVSGDFLFPKSGSFLECLASFRPEKRRNTPRMIPEISQTRKKNPRNQTEIRRKSARPFYWRNEATNKQVTNEAIENGFAFLPSVPHSDLVPLLSPQHLLLQLSKAIPASLFSSTLPSNLLPCKQLFIKIISFERILFCPTRLSPAGRALGFL
jgi:hypothetical protein